MYTRVEVFFSLEVGKNKSFFLLLPQQSRKLPLHIFLHHSILMLLTLYPLLRILQYQEYGMRVSFQLHTSFSLETDKDLQK